MLPRNIRKSVSHKDTYIGYIGGHGLYTITRDRAGGWRARLSTWDERSDHYGQGTPLPSESYSRTLNQLSRYLLDIERGVEESLGNYYYTPITSKRRSNPRVAHLHPNLVWETHDDGAFVTTPEELIADNAGYTPVIEAVKFLRRKTRARGFKWAGVCFGGGASDETFITVRLAGVALPPERSLHRYCTLYTDIPSVARMAEEDEAEVLAETEAFRAERTRNPLRYGPRRY